MCQTVVYLDYLTLCGLQANLKKEFLMCLLEHDKYGISGVDADTNIREQKNSDILSIRQQTLHSLVIDYWTALC